MRRARPARLALLGDGPERPRIEAEVRARGLGGDVEFLGEQLDVVATLRRAHVFLLPSETESFGLAALEALACGVPVVASRAGGLPEVIREGEEGFLLPVGDVDAMAAAVGRILDDAALHRRMSAAARAGAVARVRARADGRRATRRTTSACSALRLPGLERGLDVALQEEVLALFAAELLGLLGQRQRLLVVAARRRGAAP